MNQHNYYVYILTNWNDKVIYVGITNDLKRRIHEHKWKLVEGFTKKYGVHRLVWYEATNDILGAIQREKQMKKWRRQWKINLIEKENPDWNDLYDDLLGEKSIG